MPDLLQLAEGGALLLFAGTTIYIVKLFLTRMKERDNSFNETMKERDSLINQLVTNHLTHNTEALHKVKEGLKEICGFLKAKNGKK